MFTIILDPQNYCYNRKLYSQVDLICLRLLYLNSHSDEFSGWLPERKRSVLAVIKLVNKCLQGRHLVGNSSQFPHAILD